jgi:hypothetical protein
MRGGHDTGFCLNYWKLSYRRKFIRTLWVLLVTVVAALSIAAILPHVRTVGWSIFLAVCVVASIGQAVYNYMQWQGE